MDALELYESNERLVHYILRLKFPHYTYDEDIQQEAKLGLWKACKTYDPTKGKFSTYGCYCILNQLRRVFNHNLAQKRFIKHHVIYFDEPVYGEYDDCTWSDVLVGNQDVAYSFVQDSIERLSDREKKVLRYYANGFSQVQIVNKAKLSHLAVRTSMKNIKETLYAAIA